MIEDAGFVSAISKAVLNSVAWVMIHCYDNGGDIFWYIRG